jgi:molybdopterin converting factor small subunit
MRVTIRLFAILRDRADGADTLEVELPEGARVADAIAAACERFPSLAGHLPQTAAAVNRAYASRDQVLADRDELALIPPVSGGDERPH